MSGAKLHIPRSDSERAYAYNCASYIKDPIRIQSLTRRAYGVTVPMAYIESCLKHHANKRAYGVNIPDWPNDADGEDYRVKPVAVPVVAQHRGPVRLLGSELVKSVASDFGLTIHDLRGQGRFAVLVDARAVVARIMRDRGLSYQQIGRFLGGRDHSTTLNLVDKFDICQRRNPTVAESYLRHRVLDAMHTTERAAA